MPACPNPDCKDKLDRVCTDVWGKEGIPESGMKTCLQKKVPKTWIWIFIVAFGASGIIGGYRLFAKVEAGEILHDQNEKAIKENAAQIKVLITISQANEIQQVKTGKDIDAIKESIGDIKTSIEKLKK